jgi:hypothetical protein
MSHEQIQVDFMSDHILSSWDDFIKSDEIINFSKSSGKN